MFIELHKRDGSPVSINTDHIISVYLAESDKPNYNTTIRVPTGFWEVRETYEEVTQLIKRSTIKF